MADSQSVFAATFVDELVRNGVTDAVISPGKRATLVAAAIERHEGVRTHVIVDERSAAFFALGLARKQKRPVLLWCTSGTAVAEYHPAVLEASYGRVPLIVATGDRPPEQRSVRDWQSIDQTHIFGRAVRWFFDFGVADAHMANAWRSITSRACIEAINNVGPVHLNIPIREPFSLAPVDPLPGRAGGAAWHQNHPRVVNALSLDAFAESVVGKRGVFVVGAGDVDADAVVKASDHLSWPIFASSRSNVWGVSNNVVGALHALLGVSNFVDTPEVVVHLGEPLISRRLTAWLDRAQPVEWSIEETSTWQGECQRIANILNVNPGAFLRDFVGGVDAQPPHGWLDAWKRADTAAQLAIEASLTDEPTISEAAVARRLVSSLPDSSNLFVSTSMPVRDVDWWSRPRTGVNIFANRGVSGLDGLTSTAFGIAAGADVSETNVALIGDLGALHDLNALWACRNTADVQLTIVVVDNNGGGIFRNFPMAEHLGEEMFERIVATPQNVDFVRVAESLDLPVIVVETVDELRDVLTPPHKGLRVIYCRTNSQHNLKVVKRLQEAVAAAI